MLDFRESVIRSYWLYVLIVEKFNRRRIEKYLLDLVNRRVFYGFIKSFFNGTVGASVILEWVEE